MMLAGDFNSRTGELDDFIINDSPDFIPELRACSHEPGTVNYTGVMIAPGQELPHVHMMICCPGATLPRVNFIAPG